MPGETFHADRHPQVPTHPDQINDFCQRWKLAEFLLFGSVLRDDFRPESDVDVLIQMRPGEKMTLEKFIDMRDELVAMFGREVDLVEKPLVRNLYRRREILRTCRVYYEACLPEQNNWKE